MKIKDLLNPYSSLVKKPIKVPGKKEEKEAPRPEKISEEVPELSELTTTPQSVKHAHWVKLYNLILKDIKLLIRSKSSSLVVIFGPLLIIFLVGMAFNTASLYDLRISTYSDSYSELSDSIISHLKDEQYSTFKVESLEACIEGIKLGKFHACAVFSSNMAIGNELQNTIQVYVDESRMNLAHMIQYSIQKKVSTESARISKGLTGNIVTTMFNTRDVLMEKKSLVTGLSSKTSDSILKVSGIKDDLDEIDLAYNKSDINYTDVRIKFDAVKAEINQSSACLAVIPLDDPVIEDVEEAINYLKMGVETLVSKFDGVLNFKESSTQELDSLKQTLQTGTDDLVALRTTLDALVAGIEGVEVTDVESIVSPVTTSIEPIAAKKTHLGYLFPTFVVLIVMFMSLLFSTTVTVREKLSKAFFRNFIMPTSDFLFMLGGYLTNLLIVVFQLLILFIAAFFFLPELQSSILSMAIVLLLVSTVFILIGMFIGFVFNSEETATLGTISVGSLMLFFSNAILPIETLPVGIRDIAKFNPFVLSTSVLKKIMLFGANFTSSFSSISIEVYMLLCFVLIFFVLAFVAREVTKSSIR